MEDTSIISAGTQILRYQVLGIGFSAIILISTCVFQATGDGRATLIATLSRQGLIFIPILITMSHLWGYTGILCAQPLTDFLTATLVVILLLKSLKGKLI